MGEHQQHCLALNCTGSFEVGMLVGRQVIRQVGKYVGKQVDTQVGNSVVRWEVVIVRGLIKVTKHLTTKLRKITQY